MSAAQDVAGGEGRDLATCTGAGTRLFREKGSAREHTISKQASASAGSLCSVPMWIGRDATAVCCGKPGSVRTSAVVLKAP